MVITDFRPDPAAWEGLLGLPGVCYRELGTEGERTADGSKGERFPARSSSLLGSEGQVPTLTTSSVFSGQEKEQATPTEFLLQDPTMRCQQPARTDLSVRDSHSAQKVPGPQDGKTGIWEIKEI